MIGRCGLSVPIILRWLWWSMSVLSALMVSRRTCHLWGLIRLRVGRCGTMSELSFDGFLFYLFWGSALLVVAGVVLWLFER